jgi:hypothetical protein
LLWLWAFAYVCVVTSAFFWPVTPRYNYFECTRWMLPEDATELETRFTGSARDQRHFTAPQGARSLVVPHGGRIDAAQSAIRHLPNLQTVFVGEFHDDPAGFRRFCQALPGIRVWHLEFNGSRLASTIFLLLATFILGGAVVQQTSAILSLPWSRLYPRFAVPHVIVPIAICIAGVIAESWIARGYGTDFWAAASLQTLGWGVWGTLEFLWVPRRRDAWPARTTGAEYGAVSTFRARLIEGAALVVLAGGVCYLLFARLYVLESFLLGELPWLTGGLFAAGAALSAAAIAAAPRFVVELGEAGIAPVLSMQDVEKRRPVSALSSPFRRRLSHLKQPRSGATWRWRIHAIQSGNPDSFFFLLRTVVLPIAVVVIFARVFRLGFFLGAFTLTWVALFLFAALSNCFWIWWQRRKTFTVQLLYPWTRRELTLATFAAFGLHVAGVLAMLFVAVVISVLACNEQWGRQILHIGPLTVTVAASLLITGGLWLLTLQHRLLAGFLGFAGVVLVIACTSLQLSALFFTDTGYVLTVGVLFNALVAVFIGLLAYRRWMRAEWGLFGPP